MTIFRYIFSILYAALLLVAVFADYRKTRRTDFTMTAGALLMIFANFMPYVWSLAVAAAGLVVIHIAALANGKRNGKINVSHHLIRFLISTGIFLLFWFS